MAFNPPVPTPEVQTSQSSVLMGKVRGGGGIIKLRLLGQDIRGKEPMTEWDSRFSVRPANTTIYQPVCEFIGSAADI